MVLCTVDELKVHVSPESLTDADLLAIVTEASSEIAIASGGSEGLTGSPLNKACLHEAAAVTLRKMRSNGELAASVKFGNQEQKNTIDADITDHEAKVTKFLKQYKYSSGAAVPFGRSGPGTVNAE